MTRALTFLVYLWNKKALLLIPSLLLPIITLIWSFSYQPYFEAVTTLGVDKRLVSSPLLKNINAPENEDILYRKLVNSALLKDTLIDASVIFDVKQLSETELNAKIAAFAERTSLKVIDDSSFQIIYRDASRNDASRILETLSANFIDDILAPERIKTEQALSELSQQVQYYSEIEKKQKTKLNAMQAKLANAGSESAQNALLKDVVSYEFEVQKASAQKDLAQADYERLLQESRSLITGSRLGQGNLILQYIETPTVVAGDRGAKEHAYAGWLAFKLGLLIGLLSLLINRATDSTLRRDKTIYNTFGLKIMGRIPNLGEVSMNGGRLIVDPQKTNI